jgi:hypothetical protein
MAWTPIPKHPNREYNTTPADPGGARRALWLLQSGGIRSWHGYKVYVETRVIGTTRSTGEISKTYWDSK